jgi:hypothetical protein
MRYSVDSATHQGIKEKDGIRRICESSHEEMGGIYGGRRGRLPPKKSGPLESIIYHSCLTKESILVRLRDICRTNLGRAEYLKRTRMVRLNFPKWLQHQGEWIRKLRNLDGTSPEKIRKVGGKSTPREEKIREEKETAPAPAT